ARDAVIVLGAMAYRLVTGKLDMRPLAISKLNTGLQIFLLATTLLHIALYPLPQWFNLGLQGAVAATTIFSGIAYVWLWGRYAMQQGE
ncbi:MAG: CDP-alcohol phosphatidyltransferase family protein, partial [Thiothrix sp.]